MSRVLTEAVVAQLDRRDIKYQCILKINGVDFTDFLVSYEPSFSKEFGAASAIITLNNDDQRFGPLIGNNLISVGDVVQLIEKFRGDSTEWNQFYGFVDQHSYNATASERNVTLNCLDYIATLQYLDIDLELEGDKFKITNETLTPNYLSAPNDNLAQVFNFANDAVADNPLPVLTITAQDGTTDDPQNDGFEILYSQGQVKLGSPLNARYNYNLKARSYYAFSRGLYAEDILEEILKQSTGYDNYLFGEETAEDVVTNHLLETLNNVSGGSTDTLTPTTASQEITIYHQLGSAVTEAATSIQLDSTEGLPDAGTGEINGDMFTWASKDATHLYGIPDTGEYSLKAHPIDAYVKYTTDYGVGQVWYLSYSNIQTDMDIDDFDGIPSGVFSYFDKRFGRVLLSSAISITSEVTCNTDYTFKTLQATGIEINAISFRSRDFDSRFDAVAKLREYLNPNWTIYTIGDNKIWASYLYQKDVADYTLRLMTSVTQLEDEDIYTRVKFFGRNKNPNNIMFNDGVQFLDTGEDFTGIATQLDLTLEGEEGNNFVYKSSISGVGKIILGTVVPIVYINGQPIDNTIKSIPQAPIQVVVRTRTETEDQGKGEDPITTTYYDYDVYFAHSNIVPSETVYIYNALGQVVNTIPPYSNISYSGGKWTIGGGARNTTIESYSYASYSVLYSTSDLIIDYDNVKFKIAKSLLPAHVNTTVSATFEYLSVFQSILNIGNVIDGKFDTQAQTIFFSEPPDGYNYAILDLGQNYMIQALDITPGYYRPDNVRQFDVEARLTLMASDDNVDYREISSKTHNFQMSTGSSVRFEEDDLGAGFSCRYLKLVIENLKKIEVGQGVWVVAFTEVAAYDNIILSAEAILIPATTLTSPVSVEVLDSSGLYPTTINVVSTWGFEEPASGEYATAYIGEDQFQYSGLTDTSFLGVIGLSEDHDIGDRVSQELAGDTTVYDDKGLVRKLGDRLFKKINIDEKFLYDQTMLNRLARAYLVEFYKNHDRLQVEVIFAPYLRVGQTVELTVAPLNIDAENYFIESVSNRNGISNLVLAKYPR